MSGLSIGVLEFLLIAVPGAAATAALFPPGRMSLPGRLALTFTLGFALTAAVSFVLALVSLLSLGSLLATISVVTAAMILVGLRRGGPRSHLQALREESRAEPWQLIVGLAVIVAIIIARIRFSSLSVLLIEAPLRYWADGNAIAAGGSIPQDSLQWGGVYPPSAMKMLMNSFTASMSLVAGDQILPAIDALMLIVSGALATTLWWLGRELGFARTAVLLPLGLAANKVLFGGEELTADLNSYRSENFGRVIAFCALALAIHALKDRGKQPLAGFLVAGGLFGVAASFHLVPTVVSLGLLFFFAVFLLAQGAIARAGIRFLGDLTARAAVVRLVAAGGVALLVAGSVTFLGGGDLALQGASGNKAYASSDRDPDPTLLFVKGRRVPLASAEGRDWYQPPEVLVRGYILRALGQQVGQPWLWLGAGLAGGLLLMVFAPGDLKAVSAAAVGLLTALVCVTLAFSYVYNMYAQANFGPRRLFDYASIPVYLLLLVLLETVLLRLSRIRTWVPGAVVATLAVVSAVALLPPLQPQPGMVSAGMRVVGDLEWIRSNLPCDARLVSNRRTDATYQLFTGRVGVTEGMGPHLRPGMLDSIIDLLRRNRDFFLEPRRHKSYLADEGVDYVVLVRGIPRKPNLRALPGFPRPMSGVPFLRLVHEGESANVYEVVDVQPTKQFPDPAEFPDYVCRRGPIDV